MDHVNIPSFGGVAGRVLKEAFSFHTWLIGFIFVSTVLVFGYMSSMMGVEGGAFFLAHLFVPTIVCRYALNGYHGEWGGSVFSVAGGSWFEVGVITWRYIALTAVWLVPLTLMGANPSAMIPSGLTLLYATVWLMSPPLLLIVAISAPHFAAVFYPQTWQKTFRNRGGDLLFLYVVYIGAVTFLSLLIIPILFGLGSMHKTLGIASIVVAGPLIVGLMLNVMGRLCGFFPITDSSMAGEPQEPTSTGTPEQTLSGKPLLSNARERIQEIASGFKEDPDGTLKALETLSASHDSNPLLMHALCILYKQAGRDKESISLAEEALPFLLQHHNLKLSSEIYLAHAKSRQSLNLNIEELLQLGDHLRGEGNESGAVQAYKNILETNSIHAKAIKGIMQIAEDLGQQESKNEAAELYRYLLDQCSESPLVEYMWQGLNQVERKQA